MKTFLYFVATAFALIPWGMLVAATFFGWMPHNDSAAVLLGFASLILGWLAVFRAEFL